MKNFGIRFWNSDSISDLENDIFGCSVYGFSNNFDWASPTENTSAYWSEKLSGVIFSGDFKNVLHYLKELQFTPKACIAVVRNSNDIETFIRMYAGLMPGVPLIGGGAAIAAGLKEGEILPQGKEIALLALAEGNYLFESLNIYDKSGISVEVERVTDRIFRKLRVLPDGEWQSASGFYRDQQKSRGIDESNFELMTFSDNCNRNIHCSIQGGAVNCGANLPDDNILNLGTTTCADAEQKLKEFFGTENSLVFGCAGIRSLIKNPVFTGKNSLAGFMFGEMFTLNAIPMFGNLMLTKLVIVK